MTWKQKIVLAVLASVIIAVCAIAGQWWGGPVLIAWVWWKELRRTPPDRC